MTVSWSSPEGSFVYDCLFGCHGSDYESLTEAETAEAQHDCEFRRFPAGA